MVDVKNCNALKKGNLNLNLDEAIEVKASRPLTLEADVREWQEFLLFKMARM